LVSLVSRAGPGRRAWQGRPRVAHFGNQYTDHARLR
jgi:hypothetical protein